MNNLKNKTFTELYNDKQYKFDKFILKSDGYDKSQLNINNNHAFKVLKWFNKLEYIDDDEPLPNYKDIIFCFKYCQLYGIHSNGIVDEIKNYQNIFKTEFDEDGNIILDILE